MNFFKIYIPLLFVVLFNLINIVGCSHEVQMFSVVFIDEINGNVVKKCKKGDFVIPVDPKLRNNYFFDGWYLKDSEKEFDFGSPINSDVYLYARFISLPQVSLLPHKGGSFAPENTVASWEIANNLGYDYIEADIYESKDGIFFVNYDNDLSKNTNGSGLISELTSDTISSYIITKASKISEYNNLHLNTLEDLLIFSSTHQMIPCIDIKKIENHASLIQLILQYDFEKSAILISNYRSEILYLRELSKVRLRYGTLTIEEQSSYEQRCEIIDFCKTVGNCEIGFHYTNCDEKTIKYSHRNNIPISIWTVNSFADLVKYTYMGVDYINTDIGISGLALERKFHIPGYKIFKISGKLKTENLPVDLRVCIENEGGGRIENAIVPLSGMNCFSVACVLPETDYERIFTEPSNTSGSFDKYYEEVF